MELLTILFLLSLVGTLVGLVVINVSKDNGSTNKWAKRISVVLVAVLAVVTLAALNQSFDGTERKACEEAGGTWFSDNNLCVDSTKIPVVDYKDD